MRKILLFLFFLVAVSSQAQVLRGKVIDAETKEAIVSATVYLNGTSYGAMTDDNGEFALNVGKVINTELIVSLMGYKNAIIPNPFVEIPSEIHLERNPKQLDDIIIASPFSRKQMLAVFKKYFLGDDEFGKACKIISNEDEIKLGYDVSLKMLAARSDNPIVIENKRLGYVVTFSLIGFNLIYNYVSLEEFNLLRTYLFGTSSFKEINEVASKKIMNNRAKAYRESTNYFFKNFADNTLPEAKYMIFNRSVSISRDAYFQVTDTNNMKKVEVLSGTDINKRMWDNLRPVGETDEAIEAKINILYDKKLQSSLMLYTKSFLIDEYGNVDNVNIKELIFSGFMSNSRVGRMLPFDFEMEGKISP
ncbi:MAG: carboxypeptidase-like regulatory domain-containing protein [Dysgonomonas sp.]